MRNILRLLQGHGRGHFQSRCDQVFSRADDAIEADLDAMLARHSAEGKLQSGATIIAAVTIWEARQRECLTKLTAEFGKTIPTRGREWQLAMKAIEEHLEIVHGLAPSLLAPVFRTAAGPRLQQGSTATVAQMKIDEALWRLTEELRDFRDGWTAPVPKRWNERHPVLLAVILLLAGAGLALAGRSIVP